MLFSALRRRRSARNLTVTMALIAGTAALAPATPAVAESPDIVISQVYGGGGNAGATYKNDFIELFNRGTTTVSVAGWSVQYAGQTGTSWQKTELAGMIQPGQYFLIQQGAGTGGTVALPTPDVTGTIAMGATNGKVALVNNTTLIVSGTVCPQGGSVVDIVGYGTGTNCFEGSPTPTLSNTTDAIRLNNGCTDTDNNAADFAVATPNPRNTKSLFAPCPTATNPTGAGASNPDPVAAGSSTLLTVAVTPGANPTSTGLAVTADLTQIGGSGTQAFSDDGTNGDVTAGDLIFSWSATVAAATSVGAKSLPASITDAQSRSSSATVSVTVQAASTPAAAVTISQVYGGGGNSGATYTHDFIELYNRSAAPVNMAGWSVQYASAAGTSWTPTAITVTLQPGQYYLVQEGSGGTSGTTPLPTPDATGNIMMAAAAGKVALVNTTTVLTGACPTGTSIVDFVGYGTTANCFEGTSPAAAPSATNAAIRKAAGATDTNNNSADFATGAPTPRNMSFGFDFAPSVSLTTPANGASSVAVNTNMTITFNEPVNVAGSWFTITCTISSTHTATVTGGPTSFTLDPDTNFANGESCTVTVLATQVTDVDTQDPPDNMATDYSFTFETVATDPCSLPFTPVYAIQGSGAASPLAGSTLSTKGVVVGDFQGAAGHNGFYVQDATGDGDPLTSDGIFVFVPSANTLSSVDVSVGDIVRVSGRAIEFNTLTEIDNVTAITTCGTTTPQAPTPVSLPETVNGDLERYEGMLITVDQTLTVSQNFFQGRYGQVTLSSGGRMFTPTNVFTPGSPAAVALADENARRVLVLDDGTTLQNPNPIPYIGDDNTLRAGDTVTGLTGVLDYGSITANPAPRDYRLQPTAAPSFTRVNARTAAPTPVGGDVKVAAFNVLNYFNGNGLGGGYPTARGANNLAEFNRQRAKIIAAITAIDADVVGLMEIENDAAPNSAIEDLVAGLNAATAPGTYAFVNTGVVGTDEIRVGVLYQPAVVTPTGAHKVLTSAVNPLFDDTRNRPAMAQTFEENASGAKFTVVVNHLKSKGSACSGDPDTGDGQGNCNQTRVKAATALTQWLATDPTGSGDPDFMIIGDLNAYAQEDPITAIKGAGYTNLIESFMGNSAYSFTFDGASGYLDHALATTSLASQVTGVTEWHINADEPSVIDYNTEFKPNDLYTPTPYRSSDHDPVVVGLALNAPPTVAAGEPSYTVGEGSSVGLSATGSDPEGRPLAYAWDLDDNGTFETAGQTATFSAADLDGPSSVVVKVRATDAGGLTAVSQATVTITNVAPAVAAPVTSPAPSTPGQTITASATFTDPGPADGPFTCTVDYGTGSGPQTGTVTGNTCTGPSHAYSTVGSKSVTVAVADKDGGVGSTTTTHSVVFAFDGFYAPIANPPMVNQIKAGQSVPIKFRLDGDRGLDVFASGSPSSRLIACDTQAPVAELEPTENPGSTGLSYDPLTETYNYVWKTNKAWVGTCRQLVVTFVDGTQHVAIFSIK